MRKRLLVAVLAACGLVVVPAYPQSQPSNPTQQRTSDDRDQVPVYRVTVVARTTPAINYRHRGGATTIDFRGTPLLPKARGEAKVESKQGYIEIEVEFDNLVPATKFGPEYLTYVMWAITPEGRATNLGEVLLNETESKLNVTTELQAFGLVVTAEPYFAVSQPSDVVVMENVIRSEHARHRRADRRQVRAADAWHVPDERGPGPARRQTPGPQDTAGAARGPQRRAAVRVRRRRSLRGRVVSEGLSSAAAGRERSRARPGRRAIVMPAREAAQTAEDARLIALQRQDEERVARAQEAAADARSQRDGDGPVRIAEAESKRDRARGSRSSGLDAEAAAERAIRERAAAEAALSAAERARPMPSAPNGDWQMSVPPRRPRVRRHKRSAEEATPGRRESREREGRPARTAAASVEHHPRDAGDGARPDRQRLGRAVRHRPAHAQAGRAREAGHRGRHPARVSRPEPRGRRPHRQRRRR